MHAQARQDGLQPGPWAAVAEEAGLRLTCGFLPGQVHHLMAFLEGDRNHGRWDPLGGVGHGRVWKGLLFPWPFLPHSFLPPGEQLGPDLPFYQEAPPAQA